MKPDTNSPKKPKSVAPTVFASSQKDAFLPFEALGLHGIPYSRVHLRRLIHTNEFPSPVTLSPNRIAWKLSDVREWMATRPPRVIVGGKSSGGGG